jgi:hypothetical protein
MLEALSSSETSVLKRATQHNIPEDSILQGGNCLEIEPMHVAAKWTLYTVNVLARGISYVYTLLRPVYTGWLRRFLTKLYPKAMGNSGL